MFIYGWHAANFNNVSQCCLLLLRLSNLSPWMCGACECANKMSMSYPASAAPAIFLCSMFAFFGVREPPPSYVFAPDESFAGIRLDQTFSSVPEAKTAFNAVSLRLRLNTAQRRELHLGLAVLEQCEREHRRLTDEGIQARRQLREKKRSQNPSFCE